MQRIDETSSDMQRELLQRVVRIPPKQREMLSELLEEYYKFLFVFFNSLYNKMIVEFS